MYQLSPSPGDRKARANTICYCNVEKRTHTYLSKGGKPTTVHLFGDIENTTNYLTKILNWSIIAMAYGKTSVIVVFITGEAVPKLIFRKSQVDIF